CLDALPCLPSFPTRRSSDLKEYEIALDPVNADPTNPAMDRPHFWPLPVTEKIATIEKSDVKYANMFLPKHSAYFASYFTITGLRSEEHTSELQSLAYLVCRL